MNSKQDILKLIELYKSHECLWNICSKFFRRTDIKNNAYRKIATEMGIDEEIVKKKIKSLRTSYTTERRKFENSKKSGAGLEDLKEPNLFYYDEMSFLIPCISYRKGQTNLSFSENTNDGQDNNIEIPYESQFEMDGEISLESETEKNKTPAKKTRKDDNETSNFDNALNKFMSAVNYDAEDEFHFFGLQMASNLRKLPVGLALQLMSSFQQQMADVRIQALNSEQVTAGPSNRQCSSISPMSSSSASENFPTVSRVRALNPEYVRASNARASNHQFSSISPMLSASSIPEISPTMYTPVVSSPIPIIRTALKFNEPRKIIKTKATQFLRPSSISPSTSSSTSMDNYWQYKYQEPPCSDPNLNLTTEPKSLNLINIAMQEADIEYQTDQY